MGPGLKTSSREPTVAPPASSYCRVRAASIGLGQATFFPLATSYLLGPRSSRDSFTVLKDPGSRLKKPTCTFLLLPEEGRRPRKAKLTRGTPVLEALRTLALLVSTCHLFSRDLGPPFDWTPHLRSDFAGDPREGQNRDVTNHGSPFCKRGTFSGYWEF